MSLAGSRPTLLILDDYYPQSIGNPMANQPETLLDLDNLDDISLAGIEAAPEFIEPPTGRYKLGVQAKMEEYEKDEKDAEGEKTGEKVKAKRIRFTYSILETMELKDKKDLQPADGSLFSETFTATSEGLPYFKTRASAILGDLGNATIKEVITELNNEVVTFVADVKTRSTKQKDADGNERTFTNVNVRVVTPNQAVEFKK